MYLLYQGVSFHSEEGAQKWKYVVKWRIADEANISDQYNSCPAILDLIHNVGLLRTISEVGPFYPQLMHELIVNLPSDFNDPSVEEYQKTTLSHILLLNIWLRSLPMKLFLSDQLMGSY
ncbi:flocculation protein FLO11-like [Cucumis melo var. makuwa]|uniref:Flocculation protein FLO11-like n=1 Tax=Cucumis melo var. makuwa TaxID=1194695 RepID=A0A5D3BCB8_CUCMM|nr:flocculation protein FLO11-like [Cucumis melo var. makuwa]